ncbi:MAG: hypothetical protein EBX50_21030, partial [Chitinophagia bacterium]|nr:hypothetical protein [Chitinophagia bacterium]
MLILLDEPTLDEYFSQCSASRTLFQSQCVSYNDYQTEFYSPSYIKKLASRSLSRHLYNKNGFVLEPIYFIEDQGITYIRNSYEQLEYSRAFRTHWLSYSSINARYSQKRRFGKSHNYYNFHGTYVSAIDSARLEQIPTDTTYNIVEFANSEIDVGEHSVPLHLCFLDYKFDLILNLITFVRSELNNRVRAAIQPQIEKFTKELEEMTRIMKQEKQELSKETKFLDTKIEELKVGSSIEQLKELKKELEIKKEKLNKDYNYKKKEIEMKQKNLNNVFSVSSFNENIKEL